ncbi:MAG: uracil-DNA glycosylase family protein [Pleomorphochaeta sp.]
MKDVSNELIELTKDFNTKIESIRVLIKDDIYIYNPLNYASLMFEAYIKEYVTSPTKYLFLGMNPGPFGMAQTGIPFGEVNAVKNYLKLDYPISSPGDEHPNRKVEGLNIKRSEISGLRLWDLIETHFKDPKDMRGKIYIANYCPLLFLSPVKTAKNITPDKLSKETRALLYETCDKYLFDTIDLLKCEKLIGIGKFAQQKLKNDKIPYYSILHPSPASPLANKGWKEKTEQKLIEIGVLNEKDC